MTCISISQTKPKSLSTILIYDEMNEWVIGYYDKKSGRFIGSVDGARIANPLCWKSLPEPPQEIDCDVHSNLYQGRRF